jgi:hypothetical protein
MKGTRYEATVLMRLIPPMMTTPTSAAPRPRQGAVTRPNQDASRPLCRRGSPRAREGILQGRA